MQLSVHKPLRTGGCLPYYNPALGGVIIKGMRHIV